MDFEMDKFGVFGVVYIFICIFGIIGNGMIVISLAFFLKISSMTEVLICNLAIADLLFVLTLPVLSITMFNNTSFIFGETVCQVYTGWMYSSMYNSAFTVTALSIDRFCAVSSPLGMRKYRRKDCAIYVTVFTWIAATLCALPSAYWSTVTIRPDGTSQMTEDELKKMFNQTYFSNSTDDQVPFDDLNTKDEASIKACVPNFPTSTSISARSWVTVHFVIRCIVCFTIPLVLMIICNIGMIRSLIRAAQKSRLGKKSFIGARKRKITKFAVCVVICFIVCWLPVNISHVIYAIKEKLFEQQAVPEEEIPNTPSTLHLITTCVLYLNTIINPLIYAMSASSMRNRILTSIRPRQSSSQSVTEKSTSITRASPQVKRQQHHSNIVITRDSPGRSSKLGGNRPEETALMSS